MYVEADSFVGEEGEYFSEVVAVSSFVGDVVFAGVGL